MSKFKSAIVRMWCKLPHCWKYENIYYSYHPRGQAQVTETVLYVWANNQRNDVLRFVNQVKVIETEAYA